MSFLQLTDEQLTGKTTPQTADMEVFEEILAGRLGQLSTRNEEDVRAVKSVQVEGKENDCLLIGSTVHQELGIGK